MGPVLTPTYFDILRRRDPMLFDFVAREIAGLPERGLTGPFESYDEYSQHIQVYANHYLDRIIQETRRNLRAQGRTGDLSDESILWWLRSSPYYEQLDLALHANYVTMTNFELFGRKTFWFSDNLVEHLAHTQLNAPSDLVRLPFDACLFVYTSPTALNAFYGIGGRAPSATHPPLSVFLSSHPDSGGLWKIFFACWHADRELTYQFMKRSLLVRSDWSISRMMQTDWSRLLGLRGQNVHDESIFYDNESGLLFFRIVINSILYLGSNDADLINLLSPHRRLREDLAAVRPGKRRDGLKRELRLASELDYTAVGSRLGSIAVSKPSEEVPCVSGAGHKIKHRFIVRGHWRNQPCGQGLSARRLIWIKPYYKGADLAEYINKPYKVT